MPTSVQKPLLSENSGSWALTVLFKYNKARDENQYSIYTLVLSLNNVNYDFLMEIYHDKIKI